MLTVEQVKAHSDVSVDYVYTMSMARIQYIHNERASKLKIISPLGERIIKYPFDKQVEDEIKATIDWERFTNWINKHDDLTVDNLVTGKEWSAYWIKHHKEDETGRSGILDTIKNEVVDCNKLVDDDHNRG